MPSDDLAGRLHNWGRWSRTDYGRPDSSCANSFYRNFLPWKHWDEAWGDPVSPPPIDPPIDEQDAIIIDGGIRKMPKTHFNVIYERYHLEMQVGKLVLLAAHRALEDCLYAMRTRA